MTSIAQHYRHLDAGIVDPEEIRRLIQAGKDRGLISNGPGTCRIDKTGPIATEFAGVTSSWMDIDPGTAAHWLQNNFRNRTISDDVVNAYARDMVNEVWVPTHQGIAFNDKDELIDGQHRLHGIIRSGKTIRMMVTFGLPSVIEGSAMTTMDAVDRGRTRSVADQLKIQHGMKNGSFIAAVCASIAAMCSNDRTRRLSVGQTLDIYREFQVAIDWIHGFKPTENGLKMKGVLAACAFAVTADAKLKPQIRNLLSGQGLDAGTPLRLLYDFLVSDDAKLLSRGTDRGLAELTLQAFMLEINEDRPERLELDQAGLNVFRAVQSERVEKIAAMFALPA